MISMLIGKICGQERKDSDVVVDCNGVGYTVKIGKRDASHVAVHGKPVTLYCRQVWSEAQGPSLFGWLNEVDREFFDQLRKIQGVGPGVAAKIVGCIDLEDFNTLLDSPPKVIAKRLDGVGEVLAKRLVEEWK